MEGEDKDKLYFDKLYDEISKRATALVTPYGHNTEQNHSQKGDFTIHISAINQ